MKRKFIAGVLLFCLAALGYRAAALPSVFAQSPEGSVVLPSPSAGSMAQQSPAVPPAVPAPADTQSPPSAPAPPPSDSQESAAPPADVAADPLTFVPHTESARWYLAGQANVVFQWHDRFPAAYSGAHSLLPDPQTANSRVETIFTGIQLTRSLELLVDLEDATGHGLSNTLGVAGFPDLDAVRTGATSSKPYFARMMLHWIVPLSGKCAPAERNFLSIARELPERRLEVRLGKFGLVDFFDANAVGTDSHYQFLGWGIDNNAAYDYAADTHGYTYGLLVEYYQPHLVLRYAEALEPKMANALPIDFNITKAHSENTEVELHRALFGKQETVLRLLSYVNHADMGSYREAIADFLAGQTPVPEIIATRRQGRIKYGFGANLEQPLPAGFRTFARFGWNNGTTESWAYTEADQAVSFGADHDGAVWHRLHDRAGLAFDTLAISGDHRRYLSLGGLGFQLGDGALTYGREQSLEFYYNAHIWRGAFLAFDLQHVTNPGYNRDRGPVVIPGARLHLEF
jgi:high affinity Mn2+ porin